MWNQDQRAGGRGQPPKRPRQGRGWGATTWAKGLVQPINPDLCTKNVDKMYLANHRDLTSMWRMTRLVLKMKNKARNNIYE